MSGAPIINASPVAAMPGAETPLVASPKHLDGQAVIGDNRVLTWRQIHSASIELAHRLDGATTLCNLCNTREGFLVTWLAGLRSGCLQLLPPSVGQAEQAAMLATARDSYVVVDDPQTSQQRWVTGAHCISYKANAEAEPRSDAELAWSPNWDKQLVRLFTSGSTGIPVPQARSLRQLALDANVLAARLTTEIEGGTSAIRRIVCSVPPQHMFGLETSVMLPLIYGIPVHDSRPLLPADVRAALERSVDGTSWIATPLHLRALVQTGDAIPHCILAIASTMPLAIGVAEKAEALLGAPVLEIYGSTETGAVAMRRTACSPWWYPLLGVRLESTTQGTLASGDHFPSPQTLSDEIEFGLSGGFRLIGRQGDSIKVGGRRASLAGLNQLLSDLPGLVDGVFYLPATGAPAERLVLIHSGGDLDRVSAEAWLRERIDPVFLPRTIIRVEQLPRSANGKLRMAMLDEIFKAWLSGKSK